MALIQKLEERLEKRLTEKFGEVLAPLLKEMVDTLHKIESNTSQLLKEARKE